LKLFRDSDEISYLRMENSRLLGIIETLSQTPRTPTRAREIDPSIPIRAGRGVVSRGEAKGIAVSEIIRRQEAKKHVTD
jgi:hypothetical protein